MSPFSKRIRLNIELPILSLCKIPYSIERRSPHTDDTRDWRKNCVKPAFIPATENIRTVFNRFALVGPNQNCGGDSGSSGSHLALLIACCILFRPGSVTASRSLRKTSELLVSLTPLDKRQNGSSSFAFCNKCTFCVNAVDWSQNPLCLFLDLASLHIVKFPQSLCGSRW